MILQPFLYQSPYYFQVGTELKFAITVENHNCLSYRKQILTKVAQNFKSNPIVSHYLTTEL